MIAAFLLLKICYWATALRKDGHLWLSNFISKYRIKEDGATMAYEKLVGIDPSNELLQDRLPYFNSGLSDSQGNLWITTYSGGVWK